MRPLSAMLKEMLETQLRDPDQAHTPEAIQVVLYLSNLAWNESVGIKLPREACRSFWEMLAADHPVLWNELVTTDTNQMIDDMLAYKRHHFPRDQRRILLCGIVDGKIRVEYLAPAAPDVDAAWELRMYGLIRTGKRQQAIQLMQQTRHLSTDEARRSVSRMASQLGM